MGISKTPFSYFIFWILLIATHNLTYLPSCQNAIGQKKLKIESDDQVSNFFQFSKQNEGNKKVNTKTYNWYQ